MPKIVNPLTIVKNGSPTPPTPQPLDPEQVYRDTRPADWLVMPEPQSNEAYLLLQIDANCVDNQTAMVQIAQPSGETATMEFGTTDTQGNFTADPAYTVSTTSTPSNLTSVIPASAYGNTTSDGKKQLICKVSSTGNLMRLWDSKVEIISFFRQVVEISSDAPLSNGTLGGSNGGALAYSPLRYCSFKGITNLDFYHMFYRCYSLKAVRALGTSVTTDFRGVFEGCLSLVAIPQLDTSSGTNFQSMFQGCFSLTTIPQLDTSSGTNFQNMFSSCYSLTTIPQLDTSSGTNFSSMFAECNSLTSIPQLDTSSGTSFTSMFTGCSSLTTIPLLDTSNGTTFQDMFHNCASLVTVPQLNTSSGTNFAFMFTNCRSLTSIPQLNTSNGTSFTQMFSSCCLSSIPQLNTSNGTIFTQMFSSCGALTRADLTGYDFSSVTSTTGLSGLLSGIHGTGSGLTIDFGDSWGANGLVNTGAIITVDNSLMTSGGVKIRINKADAMLPISVNATTLFSSSQYVYVYVPDALLATYQADAYWNTLGTRLKAMSEWSA